MKDVANIVNHWESNCWFASLFLLFSTSDMLFLPVFVIAAAKTLLNKKADVKVRVITCLPPTSLPLTKKHCLFLLSAVFLYSAICFFPILPNLTFTCCSSLLFFFSWMCLLLLHFVSRVMYVIMALDVFIFCDVIWRLWFCFLRACVCISAAVFVRWVWHTILCV